VALSGSAHADLTWRILTRVRRLGIAAAVIAVFAAAWLVLAPFSIDVPSQLDITTIHRDCGTAISNVVDPPSNGPCIEPSQHRAYGALALVVAAAGLAMAAFATSRSREPATRAPSVR
jgi:drug/metabolite transporter (DMT)-like permease